jgi:rod shape-determining protein MreD
MMIRNLIAFPLLVLVVIVQSAVISQMTLLSGYADLMLVVLAAWALKADAASAWIWAILGGAMVSFVSGLPWPVAMIGYLFVVLLAQLLRQRVWQAPMLAMFSVIFLGTLVMNIFIILVLNLLGTPLPLGDSLGLIVLPSVLLNLLFSIPVYAIVRDLAQWIGLVKEVE